MLIEYDDHILSSELTDVVVTIINIIDTSATERGVTISCIYNMFANIKSLISFDQANDDKLEYCTLEYQFFDLTEDYDVFNILNESSAIEELHGKEISQLTLNDLDNVADFYVQLLKDERLVYQDFMALAASKFVDFYISVRPHVFEQYLAAMNKSREELTKYREILAGCQQSLYLIRGKHPELYKDIDSLIIQINWILRNESLTLEQYSVGALYDFLKSLYEPEEAQGL